MPKRDKRIRYAFPVEIYVTEKIKITDVMTAEEIDEINGLDFRDICIYLIGLIEKRFENGLLGRLKRKDTVWNCLVDGNDDTDETHPFVVVYKTKRNVVLTETFYQLCMIEEVEINDYEKRIYDKVSKMDFGNAEFMKCSPLDVKNVIRKAREKYEETL